MRHQEMKYSQYIDIYIYTFVEERTSTKPPTPFFLKKEKKKLLSFLLPLPFYHHVRLLSFT